MSNIIHVFGVPSSPLQVSCMLSNLRVGHTLVSGVIRSLSTEKHLAKAQPAWPVILPSINAIDKYKCSLANQVLFVCDSLAMLSTCNMRLIKIDNMADNIRQALLYATANPMPNWKLVRNEPSISDYVNSATKPSFLNSLQTEIYKITPYDLRKEVQALIIGYLAGAESKAKLISRLNSSHKLTKLCQLIKEPKAALLHDAVALYRRNGSAETTAVATGFETFEILYVARSSEKEQEAKAKKPKKSS